MAGGREEIFLSNEPGSLGLRRTVKGLALAGVPLLDRAGKSFTPRPEGDVQWLIDRAYKRRAGTSPMAADLSAVAHALNAGDTAQAMDIARRLKLAELDWDGAVRIARAENAIRKAYNPNEPRDWLGRWTSGAVSDGETTTAPLSLPHSRPSPLQFAANEPPTQTDAGQEPEGKTGTSDAASSAEDALSDNPNPDWVRLPPGDRIDEAADLIEWIANAKPEDARDIRREINRKYYAAGDWQDGDALNGYLSQAIQPGRTPQERQEILDLLERYTHHDPVLAGRFGRTLLELALPELLHAPRKLEIPEIAGSEAAAANAPSPVWELGWAERGRLIEDAFGRTLPRNFPRIDLAPGGIATSIKSIDLRAVTYQDTKRLLWRLNVYVNDVAGFQGANWANVEITPEEITGRALRLIFPRGTMTAEQRVALAKAREWAKSLGIDLYDIPF